MSSPMVEVPEHFPISVNSNGEGPETDISSISWWVCWCSDPLCTRFQVSGHDYRAAVERLIKSHTPPMNAEFAVQQLIQLG